MIGSQFQPTVRLIYDNEDFNHQQILKRYMVFQPRKVIKNETPLRDITLINVDGISSSNEENTYSLEILL